MSKITKKVYPVMGMHCAACANNVEKIVKKQEGWIDRAISFWKDNMNALDKR